MSQTHSLDLTQASRRHQLDPTMASQLAAMYRHRLTAFPDRRLQPVGDNRAGNASLLIGQGQIPLRYPAREPAR